MNIFGIVAAACILAVAAAKNPFISNGIVPDIIDRPPAAYMKVVYPNANVRYGNVFTPTQVKDLPQISFRTSRRALYSVMLVDPDALSRQNPTLRSYIHFFAGNVRGSNVLNGTVLHEYKGSQPPKDTGYHRYVWLAYKQPGYIDFNEESVANLIPKDRKNFSIRKLAARKNFGAPVAGNFFQSQNEDNVN